MSIMPGPRPIYLGWFIVATGFVIVMLTVGTRFSFGVFIVPVSQEFGWSRGAISIAAAVGFLLNGLSQPLLGRVYDRVGGRRLILTSLVVLGVCTMLLSLTRSLVFLVLMFGVVMAIATSGTSLTTISAVLTKWFQRHRGTAVGLVAAGASVGGLVLIPFVAYLIELVGWRATWFILGLMLLALAVPLAYLILKEDPSQVGLLPDGDPSPVADGAAPPPARVRGPLEVDSWAHPFRSSPMWLLCAGYSVCGFTTSMINTHFVPLAIDRGFSPPVAATAFGVMSGLNIVGVLVAGKLGDRFGRKNLLGWTYFVRGLAFVWLLALPGPWGLWGFAVLSGFSWIATVPLTTSLTADVYGLRNIGVLGGMVFAAHQVGGAIGVQLAGIVRDVTGAYTLTVLLSVLLLAMAGLASLAIQERRYSVRYQTSGGLPASSMA